MNGVKAVLPTAADGTAPDGDGARSGRGIGRIEQVTQVLRQEITAGRWAVGDRIPTEPELVTLTAAGRNTVREAVQALVHAGLLERRQGSGTYVLADSELGVAVGRRVAGASQRHVLEVRRSLEIGAARLAATRRGPGDLQRLHACQARRREAAATGDLDLLAAADLDLHRAVARAARNPVLAELYEHLLDAIAANVRFNLTRTLPDHADDHADLVEAIEAGDPERAARTAAGFFDSLLCHPSD